MSVMLTFHDRPNDQKMFYHLIVTHRERLTENFDSRLAHSESDYHHLRPQAWTTRVSTRKFKGHGRSSSRFTVISTVADTEPGTVRSYDPFYASRNLHPGQASHSKIVVHRNGTVDSRVARSIRSGSVLSAAMEDNLPVRKRRNSVRSQGTSHLSPRNSMSSIQSSVRGKAGVRANTRYKRGVDFSRVRQRSVDPTNAPPTISEQSLTTPESISGDEPILNIEDESPLSAESAEEPQQEHGASLDARSLSSFFKDVEESSLFMGDDWIHFSNSIARDCDAAFNSSIVASPSVINFDASEREASPFSLEFRPPSIVHQTPEVTPAPPSASTTVAGGLWDTRPLPPPPPQSESVLREIVEAQSIRNRKSYNSSFDDAATLVVPGLNITKADISGQFSVPPKPKDYRVVSAPASTQYGRDSRPLPSIYKSNEGSSTPQARAVSAPQNRSSAPLPTPLDNRGLEYLAKAERTIRVVHSPSAPKTVGNPVVPEPLKVRKKLSRGYTDPYGDAVRGIDIRQQYARHSQLQDLPEEPTISSHSNGSSIGQKKKKLSSWFRRTSKDDVKEGMRVSSRQSQHSGVTYPKRMESTSTNPPPPILEPAKKKSLIFSLFKATKSEPRMSLAGK